MNTIETVKSLILPLAEDNQVEIVDLEYVKEGKHWFLRIFIDQPGGVDLNDCAKFSELVSECLDQQKPDPIPYAYYLEVSSPGAERPLKTAEDLEQAVGKYIFVSLYHAVDGNNTYEGTLQEVNSESIVMSYKDKTRSKTAKIARDNLSKARLAIEF